MMAHRSTVLMCFCILAQQVLLEGSSLGRQRYVRNASKKEEKNWRSKVEFKFKNDLLRLQEQLKQHDTEYQLVKKFVENPGCGSAKDTKVKVDPKDLLLSALAVSSLKVVEGCPEEALKTILKMVNALIEVPVEPIYVTNTSACSSEADEALRMIVSEIPVLRQAYIVLAAGIYSSAGCVQLSTDLLPYVVSLSYSFSNKEQKFANYDAAKTDDEMRTLCISQLHELKQELDGEKDEKRRRRRETDECEKSWERSIYDALESVPIANTIWELGSAVGYAIAGCSSVAADRGKKGASSLVATLSLFFASSR